MKAFYSSPSIAILNAVIADGDVIEIALHTMKVQSFEKTIITVPIRKMVTGPFKNWRSMQEAGDCRILVDEI